MSSTTFPTLFRLQVLTDFFGDEPSALDGWEFRFIGKRRASDSDAEALFDKTVANGGVVISDLFAFFSLNGDGIDALPERREVQCEVRVTAENFEATPVVGYVARVGTALHAHFHAGGQSNQGLLQVKIEALDPTFENLNPIGPLQTAALELVHFVETVCPQLL